jgi:antirestriction protein
VNEQPAAPRSGEAVFRRKQAVKTPTANSPRIYVASLADYNAGNLHGHWIDAAQPVECIQRAISEMLAQSREPFAEEWAIHDYDNFYGLELSEWEDLEKVSEAAILIEEHGALFAALVQNFGGLSGLDEAREYIEHGYCGEFDDLGWYAAQLGNDLYHAELEALPDFIRNHIDWDAIGRDIELAGDVFTIELGGMVHVFDSNI